MTTSIPSIPIHTSIADIGREYRAWLVDIWGVMHNGAEAIASACDACRNFRASGGTVMLISNAPRPFTAVVHQMRALGVPDDAYDAGMTSGDVTRAMLQAMPGRPVFHVGHERNLGLFDGESVRLVDADAAELVVCSGLHDDAAETPDDYYDLFSRLLERGLPMICANPDLKAERGSRLVYCAGSLAAQYEARGGEVRYAGKPYLPIYTEALSALAGIVNAPISKTDVLAVGDGINTDIRGAHEAGLSAVFIASGIHMPEGLEPRALARLYADKPFRPIAALSALAW
jgi:HAD superfamily hydrolase (TIGR01459 family)